MYDLNLSGSAQGPSRLALEGKQKIRKNVIFLAKLLKDLPDEVIGEEERAQIELIVGETLAEVVKL